ncbi:MAG: zf-HC2 domain-containing protein [Acidobacteria bacterium]|nr:zf-HC2 domain-containing protein [Acidobacteriota bacterium]
MTCAEIEILICDYVDGTLSAEAKAEVERHLDECPGCAELARDSAAAVGFMERAADVEPPPELITRILFDAPWAKAKPRRAGWLGWMGRWMKPMVQPRFVMGAAMTILSFSMLSRYVPMRQIKPGDLKPSAIWATLDDTAQRAWARTVKYYENLKVVYQIQALLREWQQQEDETAPASTAQPTVDERKLPVKGSTAGGAPSPTPPAGSRSSDR